MQSVFPSIALSRDTFATGGAYQREIQLWQTATGKQERELNAAVGERSGYGVSALAFSPDGRLLACGAGRGLVKIFDVNQDEPRFVLPGHRQNAFAMAFSPDGKTLASAGSDGTVRFWSVVYGQQLAALSFSDVPQPGADDTVSSLAFSPDGSCLAALSKDGRLRLFRAASLKESDALESEERGFNGR